MVSNTIRSRRCYSFLLAASCFLTTLFIFACQSGDHTDSSDLYDETAHYTKYEFQVPMRDSVKLYTAVYVPKDVSKKYPFLMMRTPYGCAPYGEDNYRTALGPRESRDSQFAEEGYIFVYQDVRGRFMSEGNFLHMTPHIADKNSPADVDESSDTWDTVVWLLANVQPNNGRAGLWGISYPGFYATAGIIDTHPAIKASSPQAPIGDWFIGDDFHHNGAFYLHDAFDFFYAFAGQPENPTTEGGKRFDFDTQDAYQFFIDLGPLANANRKYFNHTSTFWDSLMSHGRYDQFWQRRNIIPNLKNINTSVLTVMGLFDAEDPYGPLKIYHSIEQNNPGIENTIIIGPWFHGGWVRSDGDKLANVSFDRLSSSYYRQNVDLAFFNFHLKDKETPVLPEVLAFATGSNEWHSLEQWPPEDLTPASLYFHEGGKLSFSLPSRTNRQYDSYLSDPGNPVPYTSEIRIDRTREYIVEDQRFAARRPDVLVYQTDVLEEDITFAGPMHANLFVSVTGTDADFVVKLIDVYPDDSPEPMDKYMNIPMAGYQMLVRADVMRAKFRNNYEYPESMVPGKVTEITFDAPDLFHTFKAGHRIMVQVQSSWFPLVDRNPQKFVDIYNAKEEDFQTSTHSIHRSRKYPSHVRIGRLNN